MVRVAGENTVPAGGFGIKPRRSTVSYCIDLASRTGLLLRDLPSRHIPGYCFMAGGETEKKSFPVFPRLILAKIRGFGDIYPCHGRRVRCMGRIDRTLQRLRTIASNLFAPLWQWGNNLLAYLAERVGSYAFYETEVWLRSLPTFIIAAITFITLIILAWRNGRTYCNTICPVGTVLGLISRFSVFKPVIDTSKCNSCGLCARNCKAACINAKAHEIDYSRCVACMDCIDKCRQGAIHYTRRKTNKAETQANQSGAARPDRRKFFTVSALLATSAALKAQGKAQLPDKKVDGGLAVIEDKKKPNRATPITPPGSLSAANFSRHCTACQLCVSVCTNHVLRPSESLHTFMQPEMSYERGYCRPECTKCSEVCPAGAIRPITKADKTAIQIGHAVLIQENCIVNRDGVTCGNCARHCPSQAIQMVAKDPNDPDSPLLPVVNEEKCIGCGACENLCPSRPFSAIYVEGHEHHRNI